MRTNIDIDDELMAKAMKSGKYRTKKATVVAALELLIRRNNQEKIRSYRGKLTSWEGDIRASRMD